ncbi:amidohydrolase family protein [Chloroflexota bacterium]
MELKDIRSIDCSVHLHYCEPEAVKVLFKCFEYQEMVKGTFAGVAKRLGLKKGEEWKVLATGKSSPEEMFAEMDEIGIERCLLLQLRMWSYRDNILVGYNLPQIVEVVKKSNGRVIGAAAYNPFRIKESLEEIEIAVKEYGFKYVWFHPISFGLRPDDRKCYPLYAKCVELGIPAGYQCGHSAEALPSEPGHPMCADQVALDFPDLILILTHTGWPWIDEFCSMIWRHRNVYGMLNAYFPSTLHPDLVKFVDSPRGRDKVMSGSHGFGMTRFKKEFLELPVSDETKKKVLRDNAIKVFKL